MAKAKMSGRRQNSQTQMSIFQGAALDDLRRQEQNRNDYGARIAAYEAATDPCSACNDSGIAVAGMGLCPRCGGEGRTGKRLF